MAFVPATYTGNGVQTLYTFSFPYLEPEHIQVQVNGAVTTAWTFANSNTVQFNVAPVNGAAILITRQTDDEQIPNVFVPGGPVNAAALNRNATQALYLAQETEVTAADAVDTADDALTTANAANTTAASAVSIATTANNTANSANATATSAQTTANSATTTANTANTTANSALSTANSAAATAATANTNANTALSNSATAVTTANSAVTTANTASTNASNAVTTANTANTTANSAVTTANNAQTTANSAVTTANSAVTTANTASSVATTATNTANSAISIANAASSAVANAVTYIPVANLTALAAVTPVNEEFYELVNSTGAQSSSLIQGVPVGLTGATDLAFRLQYQSGVAKYVFQNYYATDPNNRYALKSIETVANNALARSGGTMTGSITFAGAQTFPIAGIQAGTTAQVGVVQLNNTISSTSTTLAATANSVKTTYDLANAALARSGGTMTGNITFNAGQLFPNSGLQVASTTQQGIVQLTDSIASTSLTTAATPNSVKTAYDLANAALPRSGGTMTGNITFNGAQTFPIAGIQAGTTTQVGVVQLTNAINSTSTTTAATPSSVKTAYDLAALGLPAAGGTISGNIDNTATGYFDLPAGTTAQRPASPNTGMIRYNTDSNKFEGYAGTAWGNIGGGATGASGNAIFYENDQTVTASYTITSGKNAVTAGPITVANGVTVTVPSGSTWTIV